MFPSMLLEVAKGKLVIAMSAKDEHTTRVLGLMHSMAKFVGMCNALVVPDNGVYDSTSLLRAEQGR